MNMKWDRILIVLAIAALFYHLSLGIQTGMHTNYLYEELQVEAERVAMLDGIREIPGLLTAVLALAALFFTDSILAALCLVLVAVGVIIYGQASTFNMIVLGTLIHSVGFHLYGPVQNSILLRTSAPKERGQRLGIITSIAALASLLAFLLVLWLQPLIGFRPLLMIAGILAFIGAAVQALSRRSEKAEIRKGMVFKWEYLSYYGLTLLGGSRRQINYTFAKLALVTILGASTRTMMILMIIHSLISIVLRPYFGKIVDRFGESRTLMVNYSLITLLFLCYAFFPATGILYVIFIIDTVLLGLDLAVTTHLAKIAPPEDMAPSLAMGSTINHITGIFVPMAGALAWATLGPRSVFLFGALICLLSLFQSYRLSHMHLEPPVQIEA